MTALANPTPNLAAKNLLAKLMATEDITVEHDPRAQTASFNMESRVLTLPVWKELDADTLDMLIGHEVSHALHTPAGAKPLTDAVNSIDRKNPMVAKDYLNVVEDARIERMIKARFPGLKRSFATGYRALMQRDLFGLKKVGDISSLPLIDRINLQYKIGWLIDVPFTDAELALAQRVATTVTWDDVVSLSKEIYEFAKDQAKDQAKDNNSDNGDGESDKGDEGDDAQGDEADAEAPSDGEGEEDGESETKGMENGEDDADEEGDSYGDGEESDEEGDEQGDTAAEGENDDAEDGTEGGDETSPSDSDADDADSGEGKDSDEETKSKSEEAKVSDNDRPAPTSQTARAADDAMRNLVDSTATLTYYADLPEIDKGFVIPMKVTSESLKKWIASKPLRRETAAALYAAWKTQNAGAVQVLATEFDRRKAADAHKRMMVAETGSIDPNRLHAYRIAEDIFLQNSYVKDGKNHGLVLLLDMSGSMANVFYDTMSQLVTLAHFCRRVNIPFAFYGFTDRAHALSTDPSFKKGTFNAETIKTRLVTLLQDGMKMNEFSEACGNLLLSAYDAGSGIPNSHPSHAALRSTGYVKSWGGVDWMCLDNTPTNAALLGLPSVMEEFKRVKRVQVMNLIVLTDGEASDELNSIVRYGENYAKKVGKDSYGYTARAKVVWRDSKKRKDYEVTKTYSGSKSIYDMGREEQGAVLLRVIRDRVGGKVVCIHLASRRNGTSYAETLTQSVNKDQKLTADQLMATVKAASKAWKDNDWIAVPTARGFDDYILIRTDGAVDTDTLDDVDLTDKNALRDLRKAFTKSMAATKANRPLLTRVADLVSK
jgi:hypothetical protein